MEFGSIRMAGCESSPWYSSNPNCVCYCRAGAALYRVFLSWSRRNKLLAAAPDPTFLILDTLQTSMSLDLVVEPTKKSWRRPVHWYFFIFMDSFNVSVAWVLYCSSIIV